MKEQLRTIVEEEIGKGLLAGAELLAAHEGKIIVNEVYGYRELEKKTPMPKNAVYRLYSMSKPITSAAVMLLMERGIVSLSDPVEKYLPGFSDPRVFANGSLVSAERSVTIRDLMNMVSGVCYPSDDLPGQLVSGVTEEQISRHARGEDMGTVAFMDRIGRQPLAFQPGAQWRYGYSADVLGAVTEVASGKRFGQFLHDEFFAPLGMVDTAFYLPQSKRDREAVLYEYENGRLQPYLGSNLAIFGSKEPPAFESGGAGLYSTAQDYLRFATMLMKGGELDGRRYLKEETVRFMRTSQLEKGVSVPADWTELEGFGYGNLMRSLQTPCENSFPSRVGEYGWDGWAGTYFSNDPDAKTTILFMVQRVNVDQREIRHRMKRVIYKELGLC